MQAETDFNAWLEKYGRSQCDAIMRKHLRKRLENTDRPARVKVSLNARRHMYVKQSGKCSICGEPMDGNIQSLHVDHVDPNAKDFNGRANLRLAHPSCNMSKGGASVPEQAKRYGRTMTDILGGADAENDI